MSLLRRLGKIGLVRRYSTNLSPELVASELKSKGPWTQADFMSPTQAEQLDASLEDYLPVGRHSRIVGENTPLGYHLIYFNPKNSESTLSADGYESHQSPPSAEYPNRMWVGGKIEFNVDSALKLGLPAIVTETISDVKTPKPDRMTVSILRQMKNKEQELHHEWSIQETRSLIYLKNEGSSNREDVFSRFLKPPSNSPAFSHKLTPTSLLLFRYSALTFNSHKIHFDKDYVQNVEKLPNILVHGPLMVTLLLRWFSTSVMWKKLGTNFRIKSFSYKNLLPMLVDNELTLCCSSVEKGAKSVDVWIQDHRGSMTLTGSIEFVEVSNELSDAETAT